MTFFNHHSGKHLALVLASLAAVGVIGSVGAGARADILNGFSSNSNWRFNQGLNASTYGVPNIFTPGDLTLTSDNLNEKVSAWYNTPQNIVNSWTATFTWQWISAANKPADGFMFAIQNTGSLTSLGFGGSDKGLVGMASPYFGVGVENYGTATNNLSIAINGSFVVNENVPNSTLDTHTDNNPINFTISYNAPANTVNIQAVDSTKSADSFSYNYKLPTADSSLSALLKNATTAYVGFTGSTGGASEEQDFTNFTFTSAVPEPASLVLLGLGATACLLLVGRRRQKI